jgi:hypothetical protein
VNRRALSDLARSSELVAHVPTGFSADQIGEQPARSEDAPTDLIITVPPWR